MQEAFYNALSKSDQLKDLDKFEAWLISIAVNKVKDILRRSSNITTVADISEVLEFNRELLHDSGFDTIELQDEVKRILNRLEPQDRELLVLRYSIPAHLVYSAHAGDVRTVIVDGKILMEERKLLTLDEKQICQEVEGRAKRVEGELV